MKPTIVRVLIIVQNQPNEKERLESDHPPAEQPETIHPEGEELNEPVSPAPEPQKESER